MPDERDPIDAVLAGRTDGIPEALRPVADTFAALRAAPTSAELAGEAAARADFRAFMQGADPAPTLVLPVSPAEALPRRRHRRPSSRRRVLFSPVVLIGAAAAAVIAIVVGLTSAAPGSLPGIAPAGRATPASSLAAQGSPQRAALQGRASTEPTPTAASSSPAVPPQPTIGTLCEQYLGFFRHPPESASAWRAEATLGGKIAQLAKLTAGKFPLGKKYQVYGYCAQYLFGKKYKVPKHQLSLPGPGYSWPAPGGTAAPAGISGQQRPGPGPSGGPKQ